MLLQRVMRQRGIKPYTRINVKPYTVIIQNRKIFCEANGIPLVFDTEDFAICFAIAHGLKDCDFVEMELEKLVHKCRDPRLHFNSFYLIDDRSQLGID